VTGARYPVNPMELGLQEVVALHSASTEILKNPKIRIEV
jgi:hypothetical protein